MTEPEIKSQLPRTSPFKLNFTSILEIRVSSKNPNFINFNVQECAFRPANKLFKSQEGYNLCREHVYQPPPPFLRKAMHQYKPFLTHIILSSNRLTLFVNKQNLFSHLTCNEWDHLEQYMLHIWLTFILSDNNQITERFLYKMFLSFKKALLLPPMQLNYN